MNNWITYSLSKVGPGGRGSPPISPLSITADTGGDTVVVVVVVIGATSKYIIIIDLLLWTGCYLTKNIICLDRKGDICTT